MQASQKRGLFIGNLFPQKKAAKYPFRCNITSLCRPFFWNAKLVTFSYHSPLSFFCTFHFHTFYLKLIELRLLKLEPPEIFFNWNPIAYLPFIILLLRIFFLSFEIKKVFHIACFVSEIPSVSPLVCQVNVATRGSKRRGFIMIINASHISF